MYRGIWILKFNLNIEIQHTNIIISNIIDIFNPQCSKNGKIVYWFQNLEHTVPLFMLLSRFFPKNFHTFGIWKPMKIFHLLVPCRHRPGHWFYRNWKKIYLGFRIPKLWKILKISARTLHQAWFVFNFWGVLRGICGITQNFKY